MAEKVAITRDALEFMLHAAASTYPKEFSGLLRKNKKGQVDTVLMVPQSEYGTNFSTIGFHNLPINADYCGSIHSHPNGNFRPSRGDLLFFSKTGSVHVIVAYPYTERSMGVYDGQGKPMEFEIVG